MPSLDLKVSAVSQVAILARTYYGADVSTDGNSASFKECVRFMVRNFAEMGINEIHEAFSMAAAGKITVDLKAYGGKFTVNIFGAVMRAYSEYRATVLAAIVATQKAADAEREEQERIEKNAALAEHVKKEFARLCANNQIFKRPDQIPMAWAIVLEKAGELVGDAETWLEAKRQIREEFMASILAGEYDLAIGSGQKCKQLYRDMKSDDGLFPNELKARAKNRYARILIFRKLAPYSGE